VLDGVDRVSDVHIFATFLIVILFVMHVGISLFVGRILDKVRKNITIGLLD